MTYKFIDSSGKELPHVVIEGEYYVLEAFDKIDRDRLIGFNVDHDHVRFASFESGIQYMVKILATTDPSLGLPLIELEEEDVSELSLIEFPEQQGMDSNTSARWGGLREGFVFGYLKAKEQFKFTEEDMVEFGIAVVNKYVGLLQQVNPNIPVMEDFLLEFLSKRTKTITVKTK